MIQIAHHFSITHPKQILKKELKVLVDKKLAEVKLISLLAQSDTNVLESGTQSQGASTREHGEESPVPPAVLKVSDEVDEWTKTPFTLPQYDPLSTGSTESRQEARLKVRLARLQMEKAQSRQAQLQLEIKKLEIEADKAVR